MCSLQIREVMLIGMRETSQATEAEMWFATQVFAQLVGTLWQGQAGAGPRETWLQYDVRQTVRS